jgi:hypothetical protein
MKEDIVKKGYEAAEKDLQEKQIEKVKAIVARTLEKLESLKKEEKEIAKKIKYLKMDLDDLKNGKLDVIKERQEKDPDAKKCAVIIIKEVIRESYPVVVGTPWYKPYDVYWNGPYLYADGGSNLCNSASFASNNVSFSDAPVNAMVLTSSVVKNNSSGAYEIGDKVIHFR